MSFKFCLAAVASIVAFGVFPAFGGAAETAEVVDFEAILRRPVQIEFADTPLSDVADYFASKFEINILLDAKGLADAAVESSAPVTLSLRKPVSFEAALRLILEQFDLDFVIQDEVLKITSKKKADEILTTKVYKVGDLLGRKPRSVSFGLASQRVEPLLIVLTSNVLPDSWDANGGPGSISQLDTSLVITQTRVAHRETAQVLAELRAELSKTAAAATASSELVTNAYNVGHADGDQTAVAIKTAVEPTAWVERGGKGTISTISKTRTFATKEGENSETTYVLVIRQTEALHDRVCDLLEEVGIPRPGMMGGQSGQAAP